MLSLPVFIFPLLLAQYRKEDGITANHYFSTIPQYFFPFLLVYCADYSITAVTQFSITTIHPPFLLSLRLPTLTYRLLSTSLSESLAPVALELVALLLSCTIFFLSRVSS